MKIFLIKNKEDLKNAQDYLKDLKTLTGYVHNHVSLEDIPCIAYINTYTEAGGLCNQETWQVNELCKLTHQDIDSIEVQEILTKNNIQTHKIMCLCEGRHQISQALDGAIFPNELDPTDLNSMEKLAKQKLQFVYSLDLYVTGLTVALVEVLNICKNNGVKVTLYHYNRDNNTYYSQEVK